MEDEEPTHSRSGRLIKRKYLHEDLVTPEFALRVHESGGSMPVRHWQPSPNRGNSKSSMPASSPTKRASLTSGNNGQHEQHEDFDEDAESDTDPDAVYCVCRQPYNKRFMIACDHCNEWYHGACVGVTKLQGRQIERSGQKWLCENCGGPKFASSVPGSTMPSNELRRADSARSTASSTVSQNSGQSSSNSRPTSVDKSKTDNNNSAPPKRKARIHRRCIKCNNINPPQSIYCGQSCILQHAMDALDLLERYIKRRHAIAVESGADAANIPNFTHVHVVEPHTGVELNGDDNDGAPRMSELKGWLMQHPTFTIRLPRDILEITNAHHSSRPPQAEQPKNSGPASPSTSSIGDTVVTTKSHSSGNSEKKHSSAKKRHHNEKQHKDDDADEADDSRSLAPVRQNVRQSLAEALNSRWAEVKDLPENADVAASSESISFIVRRIERRLHKTLGDDSMQKYKGKYRTILLNIKDKRNETFFRAILTGDVSPRQIVTLSSEDMASSELKKWREEEAKNYLELQKKGAEETAQMKIVKKTHKGDLELVAVNDERAVRDEKLPEYEPPPEESSEDEADDAEKIEPSAAADSSAFAENTGTATSKIDEDDNITSRRHHLETADDAHAEAVDAGDVSKENVGKVESANDTSAPSAPEITGSSKKRKSHHHDTTAEHENHAFESNCKICTGQILSESGNSQPPARAAYLRINADNSSHPSDADVDAEHDDEIDSELMIDAGNDAVFSPSASKPATSPGGNGGSISVNENEDYDPASADQPVASSKHARSSGSNNNTKVFSKPINIKNSSASAATPAIGPANVWSGSIHYHEVGSIDLCGQNLYGHEEFIRQCLRPMTTFQVIGRIGSSDVYRHFNQIKRLKENGVVLLTLPPSAPAAAASIYSAFVNWFCAKDRLAVLDNSHLTKDIYMIPVDSKGGVGGKETNSVLSSLVGSAGMKQIDASIKSSTEGALILLIVSKVPYGQAASALGELNLTALPAKKPHHHKLSNSKPIPIPTTPIALKSSDSMASLVNSMLTANPGGESEFEYETHALAASEHKNSSERMETDAEVVVTKPVTAFPANAMPLLPELEALGFKIFPYAADTTKSAAVVPIKVPKTHDDDEEYSPGGSDNEDVDMEDVSNSGKTGADDDDETLPDLILPKLTFPPPPPQPPMFAAGQNAELPRDPRARAAAHAQQHQQHAESMAVTIDAVAAQHKTLLFSNPLLAGIDIDAVIGQLLACQVPAEMTDIFKSLPSSEARRLLVDEMNRRIEIDQQKQQQQQNDPRPPRVIPSKMMADSAADHLALLSTPFTADVSKLPLLPDPSALHNVLMPQLYSSTAPVAQTPVLPYGERRRPALTNEDLHKFDDEPEMDRKPLQRIGADGVALSRYGVPVTRVLDAKIKNRESKNRRGSERDDVRRDDRGNDRRRDTREYERKSDHRSPRGSSTEHRRSHGGRGTSDDSNEKRATSSEKLEESDTSAQSAASALESGERGEKRLPMGRIPRLPPRQASTASSNNSEG